MKITPLPTIFKMLTFKHKCVIVLGDGAVGRVPEQGNQLKFGENIILHCRKKEKKVQERIFNPNIWKGLMNLLGRNRSE